MVSSMNSFILQNSATNENPMSSILKSKKTNFAQNMNNQNTNFKGNLLPSVAEEEVGGQSPTKFSGPHQGSNSTFVASKKSGGNGSNNLNKTEHSNFKQTQMINSQDVGFNMPKEPENDLKMKELLHRVILQDSEDRWFLNPQYKLEIKPGLKIIISLMQEDEKISYNPYQRCNFMIILSKVNFNIIF